MITPINFQNTYKNHAINSNPRIIPLNMRDSVSFGNTCSNNSRQVYDTLRAGNYSKAAKILEDSSFDFNPNWASPVTGLPLLAAIYYPESARAKLVSIFNKKYRNEIISKILIHPQFDPNGKFSSGISSKDGDTMSYIEFALKNKDTYLLQMLGAYGATWDKFTDEEKAKLDSYVNKGGFLRFLLYTAFNDHPSFIAIKNELKVMRKNTLALQRELQKLKEIDKTGNTANIVQCAEQLVESTNSKKTSKVSKPKKIRGLSEYAVELPEGIPNSLDELGGMIEAKKAINNFIIKPWNPKTRALLKKNNIDMPNGFMMYGPPGCGKTYVAKVIAKQLGFSMYEIELGTIGDSFAYTTNNRLKKIFTQLEKNYKKTGVPSILFLDEIDSIAASRQLSKSDWKRDEINTLISLLNNSAEKGIIVIGATNLLNNVDEAVLRPGRFDKKIEIPLPDKSERKEIFQKLITQKSILKGLAPHVDELADLTEGKSCSDISAMLNICARNAIYNTSEDVTKENFLTSMKEIEYEKNAQKNVIGFYAK